MPTISVPAKFSDWIVKPLEKIEKKPKGVYLMLEYDDDVNIVAEPIAEYIKKDIENTKKTWKWYKTKKDFMNNLFN